MKLSELKAQTLTSPEAKARYDAEGFWYRGNGSIEVVPAVEFDAAREHDRGVILYGNIEFRRRQRRM